MADQRVLPILLVFVLAFQFVLAYALSALDVSTLEGQRIAGLLIALDAVLFAVTITVYSRYYSKPVYREEAHAVE
jgi:hypothetical protein